MDDTNDDGSINVAVDELLAVTELYTSEAREAQDEMNTGVYDVSFFHRHDVPPVEVRKTGLENLEDARVGLGLFIDEADAALNTGDLTVDQRLHVATILSYIEGLAKRLDHIRTPGFVQQKRGDRSR